MREPILLPPPQSVTLSGGTFDAAESQPFIHFDADFPHREGYKLSVADDGIRVTAQTPAGAFYAVHTLRQLIRQYGNVLPCIVIDDWPDFPVRGIMLDISRDRVPTMETLRLWIDRLAALKINQLQLYIEHTFAYPSHPDVWRDASPLTGAEIEELDALCKAQYIDLVPCQNGFGHMERWLMHPRYAGLAIVDEPRISAMGDPRLPSTLNPLDPRSLELVASIYDDLLPHFSSGLFNISADEPFELGKGRTADAVNTRGKGRVYLDYLLELYGLVAARGKKMQFWGDIIIHYPDLVPELPKDLTALDWAYEATHDFDSHAALYAAAGVPFYLCPGTSTWMSYAGSTDNMLANIANAVRAGQKHGAAGILTTDWGDNGHWQPPGASWPGFAAAAAMTWNAACADMTPDTFAPLLDLHVYQGDLAAHALALGSVYRRVGAATINGSFLAYALQRRFSDMADFRPRFEAWGGEPSDISPENLRAVLAEIGDLHGKIAASSIGAPDGELIRAELLHAANLLAHGAKRLLLMQDAPDYPRADLRGEWDALESVQQTLWLRRSREGGLRYSLARFAIAREDYS